MGRGAAMSQGPAATPPQPASLTKDEELAMLRQQAEAMAQQMQQLQDRIKQLEQGP
jgi:hypothetical protein